MELTQAGPIGTVRAHTVLTVGRPLPSQTLSFDTGPYRLIDLRPVAGEWQSLVRVGDDLRIVFADGATIELLNFFQEGADEKLVQVADTVLYSPYSMLLVYTIIEEGRAVYSTTATEGAYFLSPEVEPLVGADPLALLGDEAALLTDELADGPGDGGLFEVGDDDGPPPDPPGTDPTPPVASPVDLGTVEEDGSITFSDDDLLAGVTDPDGPALEITDVSIASGGGTLVDNGDGTWTYTPDLGDDTDVTFNYTVSDGTDTASSTATLDITPVNDPPVASPVDLGVVMEDGTRVIAEASLLAGVSDPDGPSLAIVSLTISTGGGSLVYNGDGTWTYTPATNDDTAVTFDYTVTDGTDTASSTASLDITPVNDPPVASPVDVGAMEENGSRIIADDELLAGVTDVDGPTLAITDVSIATGGGSLTDNGDGTWTYTPAPGDESEVTFNYTASDGIESASSLASLDITPGAPLGPPSLDLDGNDSNGGGFNYTSSFTMGGPGIPIADTDVTVTYPGGTSLTSATISMIGNGQVPPNDVLAISGTLPAGIVASAYNPATGTIALSGTASIDDYEAALRQVVFATNDPFFNADRIISVTVADGAFTSNTAQTFMHVVSVLEDFQETDTIDLSVLLDDPFEPPAQVGDYARLVQDGTDVVLQIDVDGTGTGFDWRDVAILPGYGTPGPDIVNVFFEGATHQLTV